MIIGSLGLKIGRDGVFLIFSTPRSWCAGEEFSRDGFEADDGDDQREDKEQAPEGCGFMEDEDAQ